jgi:hypothetical protein
MDPDKRSGFYTSPCICGCISATNKHFDKPFFPFQLEPYLFCKNFQKYQPYSFSAKLITDLGTFYGLAQYQVLGIHCHIAGSIPAVTPRYCTNKIENAVRSTFKNPYYFSGSG